MCYVDERGRFNTGGGAVTISDSAPALQNANPTRFLRCLLPAQRQRQRLRHKLPPIFTLHHNMSHQSAGVFAAILRSRLRCRRAVRCRLPRGNSELLGRV